MRVACAVHKSKIENSIKKHVKKLIPFRINLGPNEN